MLYTILCLFLGCPKGVGCARPDSPGIYARTKATYSWIQGQVCTMSQIPPPSCSNPGLQGQNINNETGLSSSEPLELSAYMPGTMLAADTSETAPLSNATTLYLEPPKVTTITTLRVTVKYDNSPQEISWALAKHPDTNSTSIADQFLLLHSSPQQPTSVRNQRVSQDILNVTEGQYRLEFYDTVAGDGIQQQPQQQQDEDDVDVDDPIELWQINTIVTTTLQWNEAANATVVVVDSSQSTSQLLWSHTGDFGEFVRQDVLVNAA